MSVFYKFKTALVYNTINFDGPHISVKDLKDVILKQKKFPRIVHFDMEVINAQTMQVYEYESDLVQKNTSVIIKRIPNGTKIEKKLPEAEHDTISSTPLPSVDSSSSLLTEEEKINVMMAQSTEMYNPSQYMNIRKSNQTGPLPKNYRCHKCHIPGHWIQDCPLSQDSKPAIKKTTGIPRSFLMPVEGPHVPGAMINADGTYSVLKCQTDEAKNKKQDVVNLEPSSIEQVPHKREQSTQMSTNSNKRLQEYSISTIVSAARSKYIPPNCYERSNFHKPSYPVSSCSQRESNSSNEKIRLDSHMKGDSSNRADKNSSNRNEGDDINNKRSRSRNRSVWSRLGPNLKGGSSNKNHSVNSRNDRAPHTNTRDGKRRRSRSRSTSPIRSKRTRYDRNRDRDYDYSYGHKKIYYDNRCRDRNVKYTRRYDY